MKKAPTATKVSKSILHDSMTIKAVFPSGATFKYRIGRGGETIEAAFSNDAATAKKQLGICATYINTLTGTNLEKFEKLEKLLASCKSGAGVVALMAKKVIKL